tara:strand:- start:1061 stop:1717 length:657 start_codon:yes stop_codon:yes gene_type:complete
MNYNNLKTQIQNTFDDEDTEFTDSIPDFISRAELRLTRELDSRGLTEYATSSFTANEPWLVLPSNLLIIRNVNYINSEGSRISLLLRAKEFTEDYWPVRSSVGVPKYYARFRNDQLIIVPTPTSANEVELEYVVQPSVLSSENQTNYFTDFCANALFYASMIEACYFMKNYTAAQIWDGQYQRANLTLVNEARRNRRDDMELNASPAGSGDTLIDGAR